MTSLAAVVVATERVQRPPERRHAPPRSPSVSSVASPSSSRSIAPRRLRRRRRGPGGLGRLRPRARGRGGRRRSPRRALPGRSRAPAGVERLRAARAASSSSGGASLPRRAANAICGAQPSSRARWSSSSGPISAMASSSCAASGAAAVELGLRGGQRARRRAGPDPGSARPPAAGTRLPPRRPRGPAPGRPSAPARRPPPRRARAPRWARCHARRSGSTSGIGRLGQRPVHAPAVARTAAAR